MLTILCVPRKRSGITFVIGITGNINSVTMASASRETDSQSSGLREHSPDHKGSINSPINARNIEYAVLSSNGEGVMKLYTEGSMR